MAFVRANILCITAASLPLSACLSPANKEPPATIAQSQAPVLGWRIPKTVLDVTVSYVPTKCVIRGGKPVLDLDIDAAVIGRAVPDPSIGPAFPNGLIKIVPGNESYFWIDRNFTYKVYADRGGLLQSLSSHPVNEAGTIVGNFITGAVKLIGTAIGVPAAAPSETNAAPGCGNVIGKLKEIDRLKARIPAESGKQAADDALRIANLKESMTVKMTKTIDTADDPPNPDGLLVTIFPDLDKAKAGGWYVGSVDQDPDHAVAVSLDFAHGAMVAPCVATQDGKCNYQHQLLPPDALFRQAAYVPVVVQHVIKSQNKKEVLGQPKIIAFGQYGLPRSLPLSTPAFRDVNWQIDFAETGEVTGAVFGDKAVGVGVSSLVGSAAGAANSVQQMILKSDSQQDSDTLRLQAENEALKAQIDNKTYRAQLEQLNASAPKP